MYVKLIRQDLIRKEKQMGKILVLTEYDGWKEVEVTDKESKDVPYEILKREVGGYIEHYEMESLPKIDMWMDEEGKLKGLQGVMMLTYKGMPVDMACGNVVFTKAKGEKTGALTDEEIAFIKAKVMRI